MFNRFRFWNCLLKHKRLQKDINHSIDHNFVDYLFAKIGEQKCE